MNINQVYKSKENWYCNKCNKKVKRNEYKIINGERKGSIDVWFTHFNRSDSNKCKMIDKKGEPSPLKGRKRPNLSKVKKGKPSPLKGTKFSESHKNNISKALLGKHISHNRPILSTPNPNTPIDYTNYPKEKVCIKCGNILILNLIIAKTNTKFHKKGDIIKYVYRHKTIELDKKCIYRNKSREEYECYTILKNNLNFNIIHNPRLNEIKKYMPILINYPGKPDIIIPELNTVVEYQGRGGHHYSHPYNENSLEDRNKLSEFQKSQDKFLRRTAIVWGYNDPKKNSLV